MKTIRKLLHGIEKKYRIAMIFSPIVMIGEVVMEISIPMMMAKIIDDGISQKDMALTAKIAAMMTLCAFLSLMFGMAGGRLGAAWQRTSCRTCFAMAGKKSNVTIFQLPAW